MLLNIIVSILLMTICVQDIRSRSIWWFLPLLVFVAGIAQNDSGEWWLSLLFNIGFVAVLLGLLLIYIRFRFHQPLTLLTNYFGLGDILFMIAITPLVPFPLFIPFFTLLTFSSLIVHLIVRIFSSNPTVPFAGYASLFVGVHVWLGHTYLADVLI